MRTLSLRVQRLAILTALAIFSTLPGRAVSGDWPQWRGPNRDDKSTEKGLLQDWPAEGPKLAWKANGLGAGYSGVVIAAGRIYTAGDRQDASFALAFNEKDGKPLWSARLGKPGAVGQPAFEGPRSSPTVDGDLVLFVSQWGDLVCLEAGSGKEVWRKDFSKDFGGVCPKWGYSESAVVDGDKVLVTPGGAEGAIVALNKKTGALIWRSKEFTDPPHYSSMIVEEIGGVRQYIQLTEASVAGIAAADGKLLWKAARRGRVAVIPSPIYKDNMVYVTSGYGVGCNLFKITAEGGKFSAEQAYENKVMANHHGGVLLLGDYLYGHSEGKGWTCQELKSGEAKWQEKEKMRKGSILYADNRLYLRQEDGKGAVALIEASPEGYKEHGRFDQPERTTKNSWPHPVIANGKLYLRDQDLLLCYDVKAN
jgi:outer membrane protein assembly factor BamB